jgi:hypothetical protein
MNNETGKSDIYSIASAVARYLEECEKHTQSVNPQRSEEA